MKRSMKKILAGLLMSTLLLGSTLAVNAEESVAEGSAPAVGEVEGTVKTDIFEVDVPLTVEAGSASDFDFILDPEGLIAKTANAAYADSVFGEGNLFFNNGTNAESKTEYSNASKVQTITSYSTIKVDISVTATVTDLAGITITEDSSFADDTAASVYLALKSGETVAPIDGTVATLTTTLEPINSEAYIYGWTEEDGYTYTLKTAEDLEEASIVAPAYEFVLTGACNSNGDWSELAEATPSVSVVWKVVPYEEAPADAAPSIDVTEYTAVADTDIVVALNLGSGDLAATGISSLTFVNPQGVVTTMDTAKYTYSEGVLTIDASAATNIRSLIDAGTITSREFTVKFNDTAETTKTFIVK